ncbi:hypothetical protein Tco_0018687 [Tanacetum coccineum]
MDPAEFEAPEEAPYPEYPEYVAPSDDEIPVEDQPLPTDASPNALSPGYVAESDPLTEDPEKDPKDDPANYPSDGGDDDEEESSEDDDDDDDEEEAYEEDEEEHLALVDSAALPAIDPVLLAEETKPFKTDESAATWKRISDKRTKNQAKTNKTEHGTEKAKKAKVKKSKSTSTKKSTSKSQVKIQIRNRRNVTWAHPYPSNRPALREDTAIETDIRQKDEKSSQNGQNRAQNGKSRKSPDCTTSSYSLLTLDSTKHNEGQSQALCNCCGEIVSVLFALECLNDFEHTVQASDRQCQMVSLKNNTSGPVLNVKRLLIHYRSALVIMENELLFTSVQASVLHQILLIITAFRTFDSNHNNEQSSSKTGFPKLFLKQTRQLTSRQAFEYKPPSDSNAEATGK